MDLKKLSDPFRPEDVEWRIGRCGTRGEDIWALALCYITSRALHQRFDDVCGPENWQLRYHEHLSETICEIGVRVGDDWVWKAGGGQATKFEAFKGGLSSAEKRAGVPWGVGRYLYNVPETFVKTSREKVRSWEYQKAKRDKSKIVTPAFYWQIPTLPDWAIPEGVEQKPPKEKPETSRPAMMTKKQVEDLFVVAYEQGITTEAELMQVTDWYKKGERLMYYEAQAMIDDFAGVYAQYSEAQFKDDSPTDMDLPPEERKDDVPF